MRSFFTSSLDKIEPASPYVNAMDWDVHRSQFRTSQSSKSGNRNCVLASDSLNPETTETSCQASRVQNIPLFVQNTLDHRFTIEIHPELQSLCTVAVDACFADGDVEFLCEKESDSRGASWLESPGLPSVGTYDLELELLESVQDLAIALARTPPKRSPKTTISIQ